MLGSMLLGMLLPRTVSLEHARKWTTQLVTMLGKTLIIILSLSVGDACMGLFSHSLYPFHVRDFTVQKNTGLSLGTESLSIMLVPGREVVLISSDFITLALAKHSVSSPAWLLARWSTSEHALKKLSQEVTYQATCFQAFNLKLLISILQCSLPQQLLLAMLCLC